MMDGTCPTCGSMIRVPEEHRRRSVQLRCESCGALLEVDIAAPLRLVEVEEAWGLVGAIHESRRHRSGREGGMPPGDRRTTARRVSHGWTRAVSSKGGVRAAPDAFRRRSAYAGVETEEE